MTDCGPVCNLDLTSTVLYPQQLTEIKFREEHNVAKQGRRWKKQQSLPREMYKPNIITALYIYVGHNVCVCICLTVYPPTTRQARWSEESGLFIGPTGPWVRPVMGHIHRILNQRKTACGSLCVTNTRITYRKKQSRPKTNGPRIHYNTSHQHWNEREKSRPSCAWQHLHQITPSHGWFLLVPRPFLTPNSNLVPFYYITVSSKQDLRWSVWQSGETLIGLSGCNSTVLILIPVCTLASSTEAFVRQLT